MDSKAKDSDHQGISRIVGKCFVECQDCNPGNTVSRFRFIGYFVKINQILVANYKGVNNLIGTSNIWSPKMVFFESAFTYHKLVWHGLSGARSLSMLENRDCR